MTPQFVDFNADGHVDILAATYDGSPHVALGSQEGFLPPEHILDPEGERVMLTQFWNYDDGKWDEADDEPEGHITSALAFDWDGDSDFDLLLGDYRSGRLFLRMNQGTKTEARFPKPNVAVEVEGQPFHLEEGVASFDLVDWDGDGLLDLLCGGYGTPYGSGKGAGIYWYRNTGKPGAPRFAAAQTLIERSRKDAQGPVRPDTGLHVETVDWGKDGRLDLVVGGYSNWKPEQRPLTAEERARVKQLDASIHEQTAARNAFFTKLDGELSKEERSVALRKITESQEFKTLSTELDKNQAELDTLVAKDQRQAAVWLYARAD